MVSNIILFASEVASACGLNPYKKPSETFVSVLKRISPEAKSCETKEERADKLIEKINIKKAVSALVKKSSCAKTVDAIQVTVQEIQTLVPKTLPKSDREDVIKCIESKINCQFGTNQEASAIAKYETRENVVVSKRNDTFYKRIVGKIDNIPIYVGGKVDGIKEDGTIIEVKNRMRRFFDPLPMYDIVQLQTYLFIIGCSKGELVEQLKGDTSCVKSTNVGRDETMWCDVIEPRVMSFCKALIHVLNDDNLREQIINASESDRESIVNSI